MIPLRDYQPSHRTPVVTIWLIVLNVVVFLYQNSLEPHSLNEFIRYWGVVPDPEYFRPLTLITSMFLHGGWMHLIGNMWFLWIFGDNVEDILDRSQYVGFYILGGVAAALVHMAFNWGENIPVVGASGALAAVMGAYLLKFPHARIVTLVTLVIIMTTMEIPAWVMLLFWFGLQFLNGVGSLGAHGGGVAWFAHIGGFLAGMGLIKIMKTHDRYWHRPELRW
ncbi:MAG: rhomboid family intramembrane serine protease [Acidobacteria bacterium]|nr:rhomboid family intramembrane serine protease [Acidobacteriota bacterium]